MGKIVALVAEILIAICVLVVVFTAIDFFFDFNIPYAIKEYFKTLKKRRSVVYIVRKSDEYLKEDYTFSKIGKGLAPLLFSSYELARDAMTLVDPNNHWVIVETNKDILSEVVNTQRSLNIAKKVKDPNVLSESAATIDFNAIDNEFKADPRLSVLENRKQYVKTYKDHSCNSCKHVDYTSGAYCNFMQDYMTNNRPCGAWTEKDALSCRTCKYAEDFCHGSDETLICKCSKWRSCHFNAEGVCPSYERRKE